MLFSGISKVIGKYWENRCLRILNSIISIFYAAEFYPHPGFLPGITHILAFFQQFRGAKSIVMQISFVMLIFLLFSDQISGGQTASGGVPLPPPCGRKPASIILYCAGALSLPVMRLPNLRYVSDHNSFPKI